MIDKINQEKIIGVIAGTSVDTQFGLTFLEKKNIKGIGASVSLTPQEQTELQVLDKDTLTKIVFSKISDLKKLGAIDIMIYCNSLSGAIDLEELQRWCVMSSAPLYFIPENLIRCKII